MSEWERGIVREHTEYPFAKGALTTDGVQYSAVATATGTTPVEVESVTIEPYNRGALYDIKLNLECAVISSATDKDAVLTWQARDKDGTWVDIHQTTVADVGTSEVPIAYSGRVLATTDFEHIPFDLRLTVAAEDTAGDATARVKNSSYVTVLYRPFVNQP